MPTVSVVGDIEELKMGGARDEVLLALSGGTPTKLMRHYIWQRNAGENCFITVQTTNTELYCRLGKLSLQSLGSFADSLILAVEQWNPRHRQEIEVEFPWGESKNKRMRVSHHQGRDRATSCHTLEISLI